MIKMPENWEIHWEDYYEILQIHPSAEPEIIEAAYRKLAQKYHPDANKDPAAGERMKKINLAHEVLSNPEKRKRYDSEWFRKGSVTSKSALPKPKPVVDPQYVKFNGVEPGKIQTSSFIVRNTGGPYTKIWVSNPDSWIKVVGYSSLTDSDELPLQVEIEAEGDGWDKSYSEIIRVRLDEEETQVKVELQTKPVPVREKVKVGAKPSTRPTYTPPPVSPKHGIPAWRKWVIGLMVFGLIGGFVWNNIVWGRILPLDEFSRAEVWVERNLPGESKLADPYDPVNYFLLQSELLGQKTIGEHTWAVVYYGVNRQSHYPGRWIFPGTGYILYSSNGGKNWEIQKEIPNFCPFSFDGIKIVTEKEVYVAGDTGILYTSDGGKYWEFRKPPPEIEVIRGVEFINNHHLVMHGYYLEYIESIKRKYGESFNDKRRYPLYFLPRDREYISSDGGKIWQFVRNLE